MTKKETAFYETNRQDLYTLLPLSQPLSANIEVSSVCNIKCKYCIHSLKPNILEQVHNLNIMKTETFASIINQLKQFPKPLKKLVINGVGEPLLNPNFCEMLSISKQSGVADFVEFFTNGTLLTHELSQAIAQTGVDRVKISLQGLNDEKYQQVCGKKISFQNLYDNIKYFNSVKQSTELFIKIIDIGLEDNYDSFLREFSFADRLFVEHVQPWFHEVDYSTISYSNRNSGVKNKYGTLVKIPNICPVPFYRIYIDVLGNVFYCYSIRKPVTISNCFQENLTDIWDGKERNLFLSTLLREGRNCNETCQNCTMMCDAAFSEHDNLDPYVEKIIDAFRMERKYYE